MLNFKILISAPNPLFFNFLLYKILKFPLKCVSFIKSIQKISKNLVTTLFHLPAWDQPLHNFVLLFIGMLLRYKKESFLHLFFFIIRNNSKNMFSTVVIFLVGFRFKFFFIWCHFYWNEEEKKFALFFLTSIRTTPLVTFFIDVMKKNKNGNKNDSNDEEETQTLLISHFMKMKNIFFSYIRLFTRSVIER